jgi:hypothetical protein
MPQPIEHITRLLHSDWSKDPNKRWSCMAERSADGWRATGPFRYRDIAEQFFAGAEGSALLAGFDFPIGVPVGWAEKVTVASFRSLLLELGRGRWKHFFDVAARKEDISLERPFFPNGAQNGARRWMLLDALGVTHMDQLMRACDQRTADRRAACCLFWTLGGQQVGKAALAGWHEVVIPKLRQGCRLWPFDGNLEELDREGLPILAETYPAEAYGHIGVRFGPHMSKGRQNDRKAQADAILCWAEKAKVSPDGQLRSAIAEGFGPFRSGADPFDALVGLAGMIEVVDGRREAVPTGAVLSPVEGWIFGQAA